MSCGVGQACSISRIRQTGILLWITRLNGWGEFICAGAVFLVSHSLPARPSIKTQLTAWVGRRTYLLTYSAVSLGLLAWLIIAAGRAPYVALWSWSADRVWLANLLMIFALLLAVTGTAIPNPFSLGGIAAKPYDPGKPGILALTRHPLLWALALWSLAHILANGDLAHLILFGSMGVFSLFGIVMLETRTRQRLEDIPGPSIKGTGVVPFVSLLRGEARWSSLLGWRLLVIPVIWAAITWLHRPVLGVSPLPPL